MDPTSDYDNRKDSELNHDRTTFLSISRQFLHFHCFFHAFSRFLDSFFALADQRGEDRESVTDRRTDTQTHRQTDKKPRTRSYGRSACPKGPPHSYKRSAARCCQVLPGGGSIWQHFPHSEHHFLITKSLNTMLRRLQQSKNIANSINIISL